MRHYASQVTKAIAMGRRQPQLSGVFRNLRASELAESVQETHAKTEAVCLIC